MSELLVYGLSWLLIVSGSLFYLIGAIGLVRMPDVFTRMHAVSVSDTLGAALLIFGMMLQAGWSLNTGKLAVILALFLFTAPIATHALARAAMYAGLKPGLVEDRTQRRAKRASAKAAPKAKPAAKAKTAPKTKAGTAKRRTAGTKSKAASRRGRSPSKP